ncbi:DUF2231 domain-containing protein [Actinomadura gamaensis]|uniref:DUF2231 domain-containing protein n=1 Tax=Actinomadura gamaensis TaxID=1763541 RepID=A0ABV9TSC4_9ACTN
MDEAPERAPERAKEPVTVLAGPYGHPVHPIFVTVPIGAWAASLVFDIASHVVARGDFLVRGSQWLVAVGVIGALVAASVGFLDLFAIPPGTSAFRTGLVHMALNLAVTAGYAAGFGWRLADRHHHASSVGPGPIALSVVCLAALAVSGYLGGKLAYHYGVRVADEDTQARGFTTARRRTGN